MKNNRKKPLNYEWFFFIILAETQFIMKKSLLLLLITLSLVIASCSSDDSTQPTPEPIPTQYNLIGKWYLTAYQATDIVNLEHWLNLEPCATKGYFYFETSNQFKDVYFYGMDCLNTGFDAKEYKVTENDIVFTQKGIGTNGNDVQQTFVIEAYNGENITLRLINGKDGTQNIPVDTNYKITLEKR